LSFEAICLYSFCSLRQFALLFWDVIFAPIDGVFETAYQAGPLDLSTDAFAIVRAELVAERLQQIEDGQAPELLQITDERERENKTYCVGLKWGYEREDLLEIIQVRQSSSVLRQK
jgi:Fanconi-associated nuclease 1